MNGYGFRLHILPLAGVYSDSGEVKEEHIQRLRNAFQAISSHTAREDMRVYLRTLLLVQAATKIGYSVGIDCVSENVRLISSTLTR